MHGWMEKNQVLFGGVVCKYDVREKDDDKKLVIQRLKIRLEVGN